MVLDTRNKNIYEVGLGFQWFLRYLGSSCMKGTESPHVAMTYILSDAAWLKNMYGLGVGIWTVFETFGHFLFKGDESTVCNHDLHVYIIRCYLTQTQEYIWGGDFNGFRDIWSLPVSMGDRTIPYGHGLHTTRCYLTQERSIYIYMV
jgi:hypothetical protein